MAFNEIPYEFQLSERQRKRAAERASVVGPGGSRPYDAVRNLSRRSIFDAPVSSVVKDGALVDAPKPFRSNEQGFRFDQSRVPTEAKGAVDMNHQYARSRGDYSVGAEAGPQYTQARSITGDTKAAEAERQARLGDIDSALFSLRGNLNMRSKRDMFTGLLGMKNDLTSQAYKTQNDRDIAGANMANESAQFAAGLAEKSADRRDAVARFNAGIGWDQDKFDIERADRRAAAEAGAPDVLLDRRKKEVDIAAADAAARRADDAYALGRDAAANKGRNDAVEAYMKANPGATPAQAQAAADNLELQGSGPVSPGYRANDAEIGDLANSKLARGTNWIADAWRGVGRLPFTQNTPDAENLGRMSLNDLEYTPTGGVAGVWQSVFGSPTYNVTPRGMADDPRAPRYIATEEEYMAAKRRNNKLADREKRAQQPSY